MGVRAIADGTDVCKKIAWLVFQDIRRYTYEVISQTIAIFCAVTCIHWPRRMENFKNLSRKVMIFQYMNDVTVKARPLPIGWLLSIS